jgi:predicted nucleic acid-binding protein
MRIVVSDSSCLIDLRKTSLLDAFLRLPYEILIPNTLFEDELLKFTAAQKRMLIKGGLKVIDLSGERVLRARRVIIEAPQLSIHDGFAFALAESHAGCILLTGDGRLRTLAEAREIEVHGILWAIDELHDNQLSTAKVLHNALRLLAEDPAVRLPRRELMAYIRRYSGENSMAD